MLNRLVGSKVRSESADLVLVCNILFQLENKQDIVTEAKRILRPNGRVCVIDWTDSHFGLGPDESLVVDANRAQELFGTVFSVDKEFDAGEHHYGLLFRKNT